MKNICFQMTRKAFLAVVMLLMAAMPALAQKITVKGTVYDPEGEPAIGASVEVRGIANYGVATDYDGNYSIQAEPNATLVFSYVGCNTQEVPVDGRTTINVNLATNTVAMNELVVVGYGTVKKSDATGSVGVVKPSEIEAGLATTAQDLLVGASPGVVVSTAGGDPAGGASIQIRGGASLSASNAPLMVIDGVPMDGNSVKGSSNPMSLVSPENVENMTILKGPSATAIYGSRASNGVIIITTKSGKSGRPQVNFAANFYVATPRNYLNMMNASEFASFIRNRYGEDSMQAAQLGTANTNWQKEVLRTTFSHDYSLSVGGTAGVLPYRVAVNYTGTDGVVRETDNQRLGASVNLTPKFFDDLLSVNANVKGSYITNEYSGNGALGSAVGFNPTLPVYTPSVFNNYTTYINGGMIADATTPGSDINNLYSKNPVSLFKENNSHSKVYQSVGNLQLDLKMPFLRELRANLNLGYDYSHGEVATWVNPNAPAAWDGNFAIHGSDGSTVYIQNGYGNRNKELQERYTLLLDFYLNYNKHFEAISSDLDLTAGYSWQRFNDKGHNFSTVVNDIANSDYIITNPAINGGKPTTAAEFAGYQYSPTYYYSVRYQLVSFFGRLNYTFKDRYLLTATMRRDGTSRFGKKNRWGNFPSVALGWKLLDENFMEGARGVVSELKLRAEFGVTGQQDLGTKLNDVFPYLPIYDVTTGNNNTYPIDGEYVQITYPQKYNAALKWEETSTWNVGIDYGFLNNRINGSLEFYIRKTKDLLVTANYPAGSNLSNVGQINLGDLKNTGIEFNINTRPVVTNDFVWNSNLNLAWNRNKITRLAEGADTMTGNIGTAGNVQKHEVGQSAYSFYVYQQAYDANGNPLEGVYVDQNGDGVINADDKIFYHHVHPDITVSWHNTFNWKNWDFGFVLRGAFGNWAYNANTMNNSFISATNSAPLSNIMSNTYLFESAKSEMLQLSSHWVQNASFVRCDNITLGYTWDSLMRNRLRLRLYGAVQNPFVITSYKGLDPELTFQQGLDNNAYPRPVTFTLGVVANF